MDWDIRRFAEIDSTNRWVMAQARAGAAEGLVAAAGFQTAGRGRRHRVWEAPAGTGLLASVLLRPDLSVERWPLVTVAVALAAREAAGGGVSLKWPNDLVVGDAKLGGVLAEADVATGAVVVGLGLNLTWSPPGAARLGPVGRDQVLWEWLAALARLYGDWPAVVAGARRHCSTLGRRVRVTAAGAGDITGLAVDVTDAGHLVVDTPAGRRTVTAGDVVHLHAISSKARRRRRRRRRWPG
ncbi:MAG: biotin--[acetyl-CoA-carboxylase] ligase [Acidimicrobiales bacterium]